MFNQDRIQESEIVEPRYLLDHYYEWAAPHFGDGSLFLTVCLVRAKNPRGLIASKFRSLDRAVFMRRPGQLARLPVLVKQPGFWHCHALVKDVPYENPLRGLESFSDLVLYEFSKALPAKRDVHVAKLTGPADFSLVYSLKSQGLVEVLLEAMHLPERQ